jgi:hypothetical protein
MKNTIKLIGFIAVVAVIGFSFAACGEPEEDIWTFANDSSQVVNVTVKGGDPSSFLLEALEDVYATADKKEVKGTNLTLKDIDWSVGRTGSLPKDLVNCVRRGTTFTFEDAPLLSVKQ